MSESSLSICTTDTYVYHLTNVTAMMDIKKEGLKPMVGDRSKSVGDNIEGIFYFYNLEDMNSWLNAIYDTSNKYGVELLRFNIKGLRYHVHEMDIDGLYIDHYISEAIPRDKIEYARLYDSKTRLLQPLNTKLSTSIVTWSPLKRYKPIQPRKALYLSNKRSFFR